MLGYVARDRSTTTRTVHPLGLATKGTVWYLVAGTDAGQRTFRVDRMTSVEPTGEPVVRPEGFDLAETWRMVTDEVEQRRTPIRASARCQQDAVWLCRTVLGTRIRIGAAEADGRVQIEIRAFARHGLLIREFLDGLGLSSSSPSQRAEVFLAAARIEPRQYGRGRYDGASRPRSSLPTVTARVREGSGGLNAAPDTRCQGGWSRLPP